MKITKELLDTLSAEAAASPRLRMNLDLRNSENDLSQRMLNALQKGTIIPIHRHRNSSETLIVIRGSVRETYYDENGNITEIIEINANGPTFGINIPKGQWHSIEAIENDSVIIEMKDGAYETLQDCDIMKL